MRLGFVNVSGVTRKRPVGWDIIAWFTSSPIVHAFVIFDDTVFQTSEIAFEKISLSERLAGTPCNIFTVLKAEEKPAKEYAESLIGKLYDYPGALFMGIMGLSEKLVNWIAYPLRYLLSKATKEPIEMMRLAWLGNSYQMEGFYFCTEATYDILKQALVPLPEWWKGSNVTPGQFYQYCLQHPELFQYEGKVSL
jgi:hypothetical protein